MLEVFNEVPRDDVADAKMLGVAIEIMSEWRTNKPLSERTIEVDEAIRHLEIMRGELFEAFAVDYYANKRD